MKVYHYEIESKVGPGIVGDGLLDAHSAEEVARKLEGGYVYLWGNTSDRVIYAGVRYLYKVKEL